MVMPSRNAAGFDAPRSYAAYGHGHGHGHDSAYDHPSARGPPPNAMAGAGASLDLCCGGASPPPPPSSLPADTYPSYSQSQAAHSHSHSHSHSHTHSQSHPHPHPHAHPHPGPAAQPYSPAYSSSRPSTSHPDYHSYSHTHPQTFPHSQTLPHSQTHTGHPSYPPSYSHAGHLRPLLSSSDSAFGPSADPATDSTSAPLPHPARRPSASSPPPPSHLAGHAHAHARAPPPQPVFTGPASASSFGQVPYPSHPSPTSAPFDLVRHIHPLAQSPILPPTPGKKRSPAPYTPAQTFKPLPPQAKSPTAAVAATATATATAAAKTERMKINDILGNLDDLAAHIEQSAAIKSTNSTTTTATTTTTTTTTTPTTNINNNSTTASGPSSPRSQQNRMGMPYIPPSEYTITMRQQPVAARSCGFGERDRRVIDPPPIIQMAINSPTPLKPGELSARMHPQTAVVHCSIWNEASDEDFSGMPDDYRQQRRLMGTLVASPFVGEDEHGVEGCFFCFPDLSCRTPGSFRLRFVMVVIDPKAYPKKKSFPICAQVMSDVFTVYNAKDFPGMRASTPLTRRLKDQGCLISIKKGNERGGAAAGAAAGVAARVGGSVAVIEVDEDGQGEEDGPSKKVRTA